MNKEKKVKNLKNLKQWLFWINNNSIKMMLNIIALIKSK